MAVTLLAAILAIASTRLSPRWRLLGFATSIATVALLQGNESSVVQAIVPVVACAFLGTLLAVPVPKTSLAMGTSLVVLSIIDVVWIEIIAGAAGDVSPRWANVRLETGGFSSTIGTIDVAIAAYIASHSVYRRLKPARAIVPGPLGMAFANMLVIVTGASNLPLVPFLTAGWLVTELWSMRPGKPIPSIGPPG